VPKKRQVGEMAHYDVSRPRLRFLEIWPNAPDEALGLCLRIAYLRSGGARGLVGRS
jgi:hypothetical protein